MARNPQKQDKNRGPGKQSTQFKPGESGNPGGRPKGSVSITRHLREALQRADEETARKLADAMVKQALDSPQGMKQLLDRIEGPVIQRINVSELTNDQLAALLAEGIDSGSEEEGT